MKKIIWILVAFLGLSRAFAVNYQTVKDGPVHEAYVVQEFGTLLLEAVPTPPPSKITELVPEQIDSQSVWLPGYWAWSRKYGIYLWVSGLWRRSPPGKQWISGEWQNTSEGWVWLKGFWSSMRLEDFAYISSSPPDRIDEPIPTPPAPADSAFWVPGYWRFDNALQQFVWHSGQWDVLGANWVYFPPQYIWREKGYLFNPAYWDWPMDDRGLAFCSILINPNDIETIVYKPVDGIHPLYVMELFFPYWPNFYCLFRYHYFFHPDAWASWGAAPPWWNWPMWWCYPWQDLLGLWWWWSHPGYPNPFWINQTYAEMITPPPDFVVRLMERIPPPNYVTPNGVVGEKKLFYSLARITGKNLPILPADPKQIIQIQEVANPQASSTPLLRPTGKKSLETPPSKIFFGPRKERFLTPPRRVVLPPKPPITEETPITVPLISQGPLDETYPWSPALPEPLPEAPVQGYTPNYQYPELPMQTQHHGNFMTTPKPQKNPTGPKVHPTHRHYSTLPGQ